MGFVVLASLGDCVVNDIEDMHSALTSLLKSLLEYFVAQAVDLDIHLRSSDTFFCACHLEVHIAEMILIAEDIGKDSVFHIVSVGDKSHCYAGYGTLHLHAGIKQGERAAADCSH